MAEWLPVSFWLAEQEVRGSIPGLATRISEIGYLLLPSRDMAEIPLKRRKSSIQLTNQPMFPLFIKGRHFLIVHSVICGSHVIFPIQSS